MNMNSENFMEHIVAEDKQKNEPLYISDETVEIVSYDGKRYLAKDPCIEEISKSMIKDAYEQILKNKPQQFGVGEFKRVHCDSCYAGEDGMVVHKRQTFCPICSRLVEVLGDANDTFEKQFQTWQGDKNFLENILYNNKDAKLFLLDEGDPDEELTPMTEPEVLELETEVDKDWEYRFDEKTKKKLKDGWPSDE